MKKPSYNKIELEDLLVSPEELCPATYQYYKNLKNRKIIFNQEFVSDVVETVILPLLEMDNDGTGAPIEIVLSSVGGSVFDGLVLCDVIDRLKTPTKITILGYALSMGSIVLFAGKKNENVKKVCYPFSIALIHDGECTISGTAGAVKDTQDFYTKMNKKIEDYIVDNSTITRAMYKKMKTKQWFMTSDEMLKYGLVDEIL